MEAAGKAMKDLRTARGTATETEGKPTAKQGKPKVDLRTNQRKPMDESKKTEGTPEENQRNN